ncbi:leucine-rich repeat domain-containing protein [Stieleria varia]|uniref:Leucine Rich repeats (2 copies) n=1 Tax=Stieleria varia TaxID=2528005 RepID=A0A5C6A6J3_9BACT|nr:hypothetical protein [Stieleria varia]TWT94691.1 Leucine Rich repeats (2 copies) [Stieleria varia]
MSRKLYDRLALLTLVVSVSFIGSLICDVADVSAQTTDRESSKTNGGDSDLQSRSEIAQAISDLGSNQFQQRQTAFRALVASGKDAIDALEQGTNSADLESSSRCLEALAEICQDKEKNNSDAALAALRRLATHPTGRIANLAASKLKNLTMTDEDRAVEALIQAGARIHRGTKDEIFSVSVARDREVAKLSRLPSLRSATLTGVEITDAGLKSLVNARQLTHLQLMNCSVTNEGLHSLTEMASLDNLTVHKMRVTAAGVRHLAKISGLRSLALYELDGSEALEYLSEIRQIDKLTLNDPEIAIGFSSWINQCSHLSELDLSVKRIQDHDCQELAEIKIPLDLRISLSPDITAEGWKALGQAPLVDLSLFKTSIDDASMTFLASLGELTRLYISDAQITDRGLGHLEGLNKLRYVTLRDTDVTEKGAARLQEALPQLARVTTSKGGVGPVGAVLPPAAIGFTNNPVSGGKNAHLRAELTNEMVEKLKKETDLSTVFLLRDVSTDEHLKMLKGVQLKGIFIDSDKVTDAGIHALGERVDLESIYIKSESVGDECIKTLTQLASLSNLQLIGGRFTDDGIRSLIEGLATKGKITLLNVSGCPRVTNASLKELGSLKSLQMLTLRENPGVTSEVFEQVKKLDSLTTLTFEGSVIDKNYLDQLSALNLTRLSLFGPGITDAMIEPISKFQKLKWLSLATTSIGDDAMDAISKLPALKSLILADTAVSDEGLAKLNGLANLHYLNIESTRVTQTGIDRLQEATPDKKITVQSGR